MYKKDYLRLAMLMALKVDFITTVSEFRSYSKALYEAMLWGKEGNKNDDDTNQGD